MSVPPYPEANSFGTRDGQPTGTRVPIKYVWPKRIAVILAGLALLGGIGFGVKALLPEDDSAGTSGETVEAASPGPAPSQAPQSPAPEAAQAPQSPTGSTASMTLGQAVTDSAGALSSEQTAEVNSAVKSLQAARDIRLWVVYVDAFDVPPGEWARKTLSLTKMGERDAILAVATKQRKYAFLVAPAAANRQEQAIDDMRTNTIEPKLRDGDFAGAAVAAATGLQTLG
jgi:hypothetical protein